MSVDGPGVPESVYVPSTCLTRPPVRGRLIVRVLCRFIHNYLHLAGVAVLYYDFFLTFGEEYFRVWKNPRTVSSILFYLNRYLPILGDIAVNTGNFHIFPNEQVRSSAPTSCRQYAFFRQLLLIINQVVVCFILFLRTYALYGRDKRILVLVIGVGAALLGISCWSIVGQRQGVELRGGCHLEAEHMTAIRLAVSWESLFAFDLMIFTLTVCKTFRERYRHRITSGRHDIISLILRDGTQRPLRFLRRSPLTESLFALHSSVSVTMMSRLMLNLHGSALGRDLVDSSSGYPTTSENITPMFFTSRISMPAAGLTTTFNAAPDPGSDLRSYDFDYHHPDRPRPARARGFRDGVYVREVGGPGGSGGYIEEYELQDVRYRGDDDDDARDAALKNGKLQV
ncbi:hypothetical protein FKP32DRAFT_1567581 [Trametes sanguinea]|nr:hypothetical protein FKP32DRAFT_1567581 [Trametes sanguinea]